MVFWTLKGELVKVFGKFVYDVETDEMIGEMMADDRGIIYENGVYDCIIEPEDWIDE